MDIKCKVFDSIKPLEKYWPDLEDENSPFTDYRFLDALEDSGSLGERTGWFPHYLCCMLDGQIISVYILFAKTNSYGEYIFDWDWANAYQRYGLPYYPKLVSAIPFTPATTSKFLVKHGENRDLCFDKTLELLESLEERFSSIHQLFIPKDEVPQWQKCKFLRRLSHQYHWHNRGYEDFDSFLCELKGKKAKEIRRERRKISEYPELEIKRLTGDSIEAHHAEAFYGFYLTTLDKKRAIPYLTQEFFSKVFNSMKDNILLTVAQNSGGLCAASLCFFKGDKLFGRYWGAKENEKHLHFELCYYQPIEFALERKFTSFEAGAQGSHKIQRGFIPSWTYSTHKIMHPEFASGIRSYIEQENQMMEEVFAEDCRRQPFKSI